MPTLTTTATYQNGVLLPRIKPTFPVAEIVVIYVSDKKNIMKMEQEDERVWQKIEPKYRKVRAKLSKKKFPTLYV